jgi:tetratricopeptide (TPR) repeat protein
VLEAHMSDDVLAQLSAMLDTFTGWYQARTEELPLQSRAVFDALALNWDPMTAADVGKITGLDTPTVSSHLSRLEKNAYVETVSLSKTKKSRNGYQVSERFFNIWYLMRNGPRRTRQAIRFLTIFLRSCFSRQELHAMAKDKLLNGSGRVESTLALAATIGDSRLRSRLLDTAENYLGQSERMGDARDLLDEIRKTGISKQRQHTTDTKTQRSNIFIRASQLIKDGKYLEAEDVYRQAIAQDKKDLRPWGALGDLLKDHLKRYEDAEAAYRKAISLDETDERPWYALGNLLQYRLKRYEQAEVAYRKAIALNEKEAGTWGGLGDLLHYRLDRYEEAEVAYRKAIALDGKWNSPLIAMGKLIVNHFHRYEEAETLYRNAIALDKRDARPWDALGMLLQDHLERYEEAEAAYRKAIELDAQTAYRWGRLGNLLHYRLKRYEEVETIYRKAIELDKTNALTWGWLGDLLNHQFKRYEEAEAAYRNAIVLDENWGSPLIALGNLLYQESERFEEAEALFRKAISLNEKDTRPWGELGNLLHYRLDRYEEAENAYRKSIALNEKSAYQWCMLGNLLQDHLERYEEAEAAYRKAITLDNKWAAPWGELGNLLQDHLDRYEEAETAYRKAIAMSEKYDVLLNRLGNLLQDYLWRDEDALAAYKQGLAMDPQNSILLANSAYLCALHLGQAAQARDYAQKAEAGLTPAGKYLLNSMLAWSDGSVDAASSGWTKLHQAVSCGDEDLWSDYVDDLQRILAYATVRGDGETVRKWMTEADYPMQYAPLFHAYCAILDGEDHLLSINPEVRGMAEKIYRGLARMVELFKRNGLPTKHKPSNSKTK